MGNLTVTGAAGGGHTRMWPCTQPMPNASVNNFVAGQTSPNFATATADANGDVHLHLSRRASAVGPDRRNRHPGSTRPGTQTRHPHYRQLHRLRRYRQTGRHPATSKVMVPAKGKVKIHVGAAGQTVMGNLTVTGAAGTGMANMGSCAAPMPNASVDNYQATQPSPTFAAVNADANGDVCIFTTAQANLIWDQVIETTTPAAHVGVRKLDTRSAGSYTVYDAAGKLVGTPPPAGSPSRPRGKVKVHVGAAGQTVMGHLTVTGAAGSGHTRMWPCTQPMPNSSVNNYAGPAATSNFAAVNADANGDVCVYTSAQANLIWDQTVESTPRKPTRRCVYSTPARWPWSPMPAAGSPPTGKERRRRGMPATASPQPPSRGHNRVHL